MINEFILIDFFRIFFSITFTIKLYYTLVTTSFNFRRKEENFNFFLIIFSIILVTFFGIGIYSNQIIILIFLLQRIIFSRILMYTLEDVYFHIATIFLIFVDSSNYIFIIETDLFSFQNTQYYNNAGIFLIAIGLSGTMLNASLAKFNEKIWHNGKAIMYFFNLPYRRRIIFPKIFKNLNITTLLGKSQIFIQMLLLPSIFFFPHELSILVIFLNMVFCLTLVLFFHFLWLAELCLIEIILVLLLKYQNHESLNLVNIYNQYQNDNLLIIFLSLSFVFIILHPFLYYIIKSNNLLVKKLKIIVYFFNRIIFGLVPIRVFNSLHILNPIVFKIFTNKKNKNIEVFEMYKKNAELNLKWMGIKPTFFSALTYKVTDFLIEIEKDKLSLDRKKILEGILTYIIKYELRENIKKRFTFFFKIAQIDTSKISNFNKNSFDFKNAIKIDYVNRKIKIFRFNKKIFPLKTYRDISRTNLKISLDN